MTYRPRSTLKALIKQMYDTGKWRREVVRRHPDTASVRYLAPPAAVVAIGVGTLGALLGRVTGSRFLQLGALAPAGYAAFVAYVMATAPRDPAAGGATLAAGRAGRHPPGLGERVPGRTPLTGSSGAGGWCVPVATCCSNFPSVDGFCGATRRTVLNFPSVDGKLPHRRGRRRELPSTDGFLQSGDRASEGAAACFGQHSCEVDQQATDIGRHLRRTADTSGIHSRLRDSTLNGMTTPQPKALNTRRPFTRKEALLSGLADNDLAGHRFRRIFHGIYVAADVEITVAVRARAALLVAPPGSYASHHTAVLLWGGWTPPTSEIHLSSPIRSTRSERRGVVAHVADPDLTPRRRHGVTVSPPARAFLELASTRPNLVDLVVAGDSLVPQPRCPGGSGRRG